MRTGVSIPILAVTLALTVFLTSLVLESTNGDVRRAKIDNHGLVSTGFTRNPGALLGQYERHGATETNPAQNELRRIRANQLLAQAHKFGNASNTEGAAELCRAALAANPDSTEAMELLGTITFAGRQYSETEKWLSRLLELQPAADPMNRMRLAVAQMRQKKYEPAYANLQTVELAVSDDGALQFALACTCSSLNRKDLALQHLEQASNLLGFGLIPHLGDTQLDNIRNTDKFREICAATRKQLDAPADISAPAAGTSTPTNNEPAPPQAPPQTSPQ